MRLVLVRPLWGVDLSRGLAPFAPLWRERGYEALEAAMRMVPDRTDLARALRHHGFRLIPQIHTHGLDPGGPVRVHLESLTRQLEECLDLEPLFFNAHSGYDGWTEAEAIDFFGQALELEARLGVTICHETHRQRYLGIPWHLPALIRAFPTLKLTCDFSHWVCVCERLLPDLDDILGGAARHCHYLHARVGFEQGPQVPDPRAPEYARHLAAHEHWWRQVWTAQQARGMSQSPLAPEFGPPPYLSTIPYTQAPVAELAEICDWMARREQEQFERHEGRQLPRAGGG